MESVDKLEKFLQAEYVDNEGMGSPDMETAIRDVLTDLIHLGDKYTLNVRKRVESAYEVYEEELLNELRQRTGCQD